jgi:excinuclease ABC subunit C
MFWRLRLAVVLGRATIFPPIKLDTLESMNFNIAKDGFMVTSRQYAECFQSFGPSILARSMFGSLRTIELPHDRLSARKMLNQNCPDVPGVYGWLNDKGHLIYIGKSKSMRKRLLSYFAKQPSDEKMTRIRQQSHRVAWQSCCGELLALVREQELIHRWRPEYNSQGQPTRTQPAFLSIGGRPAPNARLTRQFSPAAAHCFGPISGTKRLRDAIFDLNRCFQLRDCPDKTKFNFSDQKRLFEDSRSAKCLRYELGTCPAPCAGACSFHAYHRNIERAVQFLNGADRSVLSHLQQQMNRFAAVQAFERAARLRDCRTNLSWLDRRLSRLRDARHALNGVLSVRASKSRTAWIILRGGQIVHTMTRPDRPPAAAQTISRLNTIAQQQYRIPASSLEMNLQLIVIGWLDKNPLVDNQWISFDQAIDFCCTVRSIGSAMPGATGRLRFKQSA